MANLVKCDPADADRDARIVRCEPPFEKRTYKLYLSDYECAVIAVLLNTGQKYGGDAGETAAKLRTAISARPPLLI